MFAMCYAVIYCDYMCDSRHKFGVYEAKIGFFGKRKEVYDHYINTSIFII